MQHINLVSSTKLLGAIALALAVTNCVSEVRELGEEPGTVVEHIEPLVVDKLDLLIVIDNSGSMADKQKMLGEAIPTLVKRFITPPCVNTQGDYTGDLANALGECPTGTRTEMQPVSDVHIGVISSSLGTLGNGPYCDNGTDRWNANDDGGRLIPGERSDLEGEAPFLSWTRGDGLTELLTGLERTVAAVGETGCGFEAPLEAWRRFLVDPEPSASAEPAPCFTGDNELNCLAPTGLDSQLLEQRADFLRPDSLVAVIQLTDEDDCSASTDAPAWMTSTLVLGNDAMPGTSSACATNPNDVCCHSCGIARPTGCAPDPTCDDMPRLAREDDNINLRCWDQKRRFGLDLLWPVERYVDALTKPTVLNRAGDSVQNPLFAEGRDPRAVFFAAITGVPHVNITAANGRPLRASDLREQDQWQGLVGNATASPPIPPSDPFMRQSVEPRDGIEAGNAINGSERPIPGLNDLQYSCIVELAEPRECAGTLGNCDCESPSDSVGNPLCNGTIQTHAKAHPATRVLRVLKGFAAKQRAITPGVVGEDNAIIGTVCPEIVAPAPNDEPVIPHTASSHSGLHGTMHALIDHVKVVSGQ